MKSTRESVTERLRGLVARLQPWPTGAHLVGGAVRDALRGEASSDLDWVVEDPRAAALELAAAQGGSPFEMDAS
ncbi:MAG: hypothetical protein WCY60_07870, partial [Trueperaceae bacterium]